jgi:2-methylcitrate dehydratase PrpD
MSTAGLTVELARRSRAVGYGGMPDHIRALVRQCVLDTLGVAIAGAEEELVRILAAELADQGGAAVAGAPGLALRLPARSAALLHGTVAHALDYDDVNMAMPGHPSVAILPAVMALAEERGASGEAVMAAFAAGYETACRLGRALAPGHYDGLGFHATGTIGTFGAAAGCAHLLGLDEARTVHALGIAATEAAGLKSLFGTMCKPLHAGRAAEAGLLAARLAARGFTARPDAIECRQGFAATHSPDFKPEAALAEPEGGWHLRSNLFKYHAACYLTHAGIEAARRLRAAHGLKPDDIAAITLRVDQATDRVCNIPAPRTGLEAKFSLRLTTAMALAGTETGALGSYSAGTAADPALVALRDRVVIDFQSGWPHTRAELDLRLRDQTTLHAEHDSGIPAPDVAEQGRRLVDKFLALTVPVLGEARAHALKDAIGRLDALTDLADIAALWAPPAAASAAAE